jgi:hypothetical protein
MRCTTQLQVREREKVKARDVQWASPVRDRRGALQATVRRVPVDAEEGFVGKRKSAERWPRKDRWANFIRRAGEADARLTFGRNARL